LERSNELSIRKSEGLSVGGEREMISCVVKVCLYLLSDIYEQNKFLSV